MSPSTSTSTTSTSNSYPFKDTLFTFISSLNLCIDEVAHIRKSHPKSASLHSLKRYLSSYSAALSDEYNYHHTGALGSRIETGDSTSIFDIEKLTSQLRTYVLAPLHEVAVRGAKPERGFTELKETAVGLCDDVLRVIEYLAVRLMRKSASKSTSASEKRHSYTSSHVSKSEKREKREYSPPYVPSYEYEHYYETAPAPRPVYVPESSYYGVRPPLYAQPQMQQPKYVSVRDPYGGIMLVRADRYRR